MENKYLNDGRKVAVIGKLNSQETIVQEIFVKESGVEIPSGENFVVKSLHDEPVKSWKEKQEEKVERNLKELEERRAILSKEISNMREKLKANKELIRQSDYAAKYFNETEADMLSAFLSGSVEYMVEESYGWSYKLVKFEDALSLFDSYWDGEQKYERLKYGTIFGHEDGYLEFDVCRYSTEWGGSKSLYPFLSKEEALNFIKEKVTPRALEEARMDKKELDSYISMGVVFDKEVLEAVHRKEEKRVFQKKSEIQEKIKNLTEELECL